MRQPKKKGNKYSFFSVFSNIHLAFCYLGCIYIASNRGHPKVLFYLENSLNVLKGTSRIGNEHPGRVTNSSCLAAVWAAPN